MPLDAAAYVLGTCLKDVLVGRVVLLLNTKAPVLQALVSERSSAMAKGLVAGLNVQQNATARTCLYFALCFDAVMLSNSFCQGKF